MKLPKFINQNITLKITSVNAVVVSIRLIVSVFLQRIVSGIVGEAGYAVIGQIRNMLVMLTSTSSLGVFSGVVKYISEFKNDKQEINNVFSTVALFVLVGVLLSSSVLFFGADYLALYVFETIEYVFVFKLLAVIVPFIAVNRVCNAVVNGLSAYKKYAKIEVISYLLGASLTLVGALKFGLEGVIVAIVIVPILQLIVLVSVFGKILKNYIVFKGFKLSLIYKNKLLAFTLMSFVSAFLISFVELNIISVIKGEIGKNEAGHWVAVSFISKNYMVFASALFTLYVLPKFATIKDKTSFKNEVIHIYKTILPIFGAGMLLVFFLKTIVLQIIFPKFQTEAIEPLFKWQLLGDFLRLCSLVLAHQFIAKRLVKSFVITELISLALFYGLSNYFIIDYGTEGVVIAHFVRYVIYLIIVIISVWYYFHKNEKVSN